MRCDRFTILLPLFRPSLDILNSVSFANPFDFTGTRKIPLYIHTLITVFRMGMLQASQGLYQGLLTSIDTFACLASMEISDVQDIWIGTSFLSALEL